MPDTDFWSGLPTLQKVQLCIGFAGLALAATDFLLNNAAVLIWLGSTIWLGLSTDVQFWHLFLLGILVVGGKHTLAYFNSNEDDTPTSSSDTERPEWMDTTTAIIEGVRWRWEWNPSRRDGLGRRTSAVKHLTPYCPQVGCDFQLEFSGMGHIFTECPRCGYEVYFSESQSDLWDRMKKEIERRARNGELENGALKRSGKTQVEEVLWEWEALEGEVEEKSLIPYCPQCEDYEVRLEDSVTQIACGVVCEECGYKKKWAVTTLDLKDRVRRAIESDL